MPRYALLIVLAGLLIAVPATFANHIPGHSCSGCASHEEWPTINGKFKKATGGRDARYNGTRRKSDELLGHHGSDTLSGRGGSDVLWGDHDPNGQPASQNDLIFGGDGNDFIYGSHGRNVINGGRRQRRDLRPLRARDRRLRAGPRHLPRRQVAQARLQVPQLREGRLPLRAPARRAG